MSLPLPFSNNESIIREADDIILQTNIGTVQTNLDTEASTRNTNDVTLQTNVDTVQTNLNTETLARTNAGTTLQTNIDAVQTNLDTTNLAQTNAGTTLQTNLNTETLARTNADTTLQGNIGTVQTNLNIDTLARTNADTTLQGNIDDVQTNLNTENLARTNADTTLQGNIDDVQTNLTALIATKGTTNGICPLSGGVIPNEHLPPLAITKPTVYASIALRDAGIAQEGDVAIVTDVGKSYIYTGTVYVELLTTGGISSVNAKTGGSITLNTAEIPESGDSRYYTAARDALKVDVAGALITGISSNLSTLNGILTPSLLTIPEINYTPISTPSEVEGKVYFDTTDKLLKYYDGVQWVEMGTNIIVESHASMTSRTLPSPYFVVRSGAQYGRDYGVFTYPFNSSTATQWYSLARYDSTTGVYTGSNGLTGITEPGEYVTIDHGNSEHICRFAFKYNPNTIQNFNIVYSEDGITYTSAYRQVGLLTGNALNEYTIMITCTRARYWGIQVDAISPSAGVNDSAVIDGLTFYRIKIEKTLQTDVNTLSDLLTPEMLSIPAVVYNPVVEPSAAEGKVYFDSTDKLLKYNNGTAWVDIGNNLTTKAHPSMTSDNTPSPYIVSYSSVQYGLSWQAFDFTNFGYGWNGFQSRYNTSTGAFLYSTSLPGVAGTGDWLVLDHSVPVKINSLDLIFNFSGSPVTFSIIYSMDGVNYSVAHNQTTGLSAVSWTIPHNIKFNSVAGRYWGIMVHTTNGGGSSRCVLGKISFFKWAYDGVLYDIESAAGITPVDDIVSHHDLTSNYSNPEWVVTANESGVHQYAFQTSDGANTSTYTSGFTSGVANNLHSYTINGVVTNGPWFKFDMTRPKNLSKFRFKWRSTGQPIQWKIWVSLEGTNWTLAQDQNTDYDNSSWSLNTYSSYINFTPVSAKHILIQFLKKDQIIDTGVNIIIEELEFQGDNDDVTETSLSGKIILDGSIISEEVRINNYSLVTENDYLRVKHTTGSSMVIGRPMINATASLSSCHIDYSTMLPGDMLAPITVAGGVNKCWGQTATYLANQNLLAGRIVSLADQSVGSDSINGFKVGYIKVGAAIVPANTPIGITQHDCLVGNKIIVCIHGYTTAITLVGDLSPERGSVVLAGADADLGKVRIGVPAAAIQARIGFCAQSNVVAVNGPVLIHYEGFFQAT